MKPEDSHVYAYNYLGDGKYELLYEYAGWPLRPIEGIIVTHNPPIQQTINDLYSHLGKK